MRHISRLLVICCFLLVMSVDFSDSSSVWAKSDPVVIDAFSGIRDYVMANGAAQRSARAAGVPPSNTMLSIPSVYIFSPKGELLYLGTASTVEKTTSVLEGLPGSVGGLAPVVDAPKLASILEIVPEFKAAEQTILEDGHYVVYVVTMKREQPTATQKSVAALRARAKDLPIDTLVIHLQE